MIESVKLQQAGATWWHCEEPAPTLTKAALGLFFYEVLKIGAQIGTVWPFDIQYNVSPVYVSVFMTEQMKNNLEKKFKYRFRVPPEVHLN